jgi:hypothetical protein
MNNICHKSKKIDPDVTFIKMISSQSDLHLIQHSLYFISFISCSYEFFMNKLNLASLDGSMIL